MDCPSWQELDIDNLERRENTVNQPRDGTEYQNEQEVVFRGHVDECIEHFRHALLSQLPEGLQGAAEQRKPVVQFCDVDDAALRRLLQTERNNMGALVIRMMCYLDMVGYRVIELENLPAGVRGFTELIGYRLLHPQHAYKLVGFRDTSSLYDVIKGRRGLDDSKRHMMFEEWKKPKN